MELYGIDSPSCHEQKMSAFITGFLAAKGIRYRTDKCGNIYATKGSAKHYPCLVAHMDEVHTHKPQGYRPVNFRNQIVFGYDMVGKGFVGIGADDKNGIWMCLRCLTTEPVLKCVFFVQEENGRIGSGRCNMAFFDDCRFVIQCDRRGGGDFITHIEGTELCSAEFTRGALSKSSGYAVTYGLVTDVYTLKQRGLRVSCANISCGYYNPHTPDEYTRIDDLYRCLRFVRGVIRNCTRVYPHRHTPPLGGYHRNYGRLSSYYETEEIF